MTPGPAAARITNRRAVGRLLHLPPELTEVASTPTSATFRQAWA